MPPADTAAVERLIQLTRTGDPAARRELAAQACDRLRALTRTMLRADFARVRRWEETDDVYQNAVLRLHRALAEVTPESATHFYRLAALQVRRELLSLAEHYYGPQGAGANHHTDGHPADGGGGTLPAVPAPGDGPETIAEWTDFHTAAGTLPDEEREVFDLVWYQGLSQDEAAVVLNVSTAHRSFSEYVALREGLLAPDRPPVTGMSRLNPLPITNDQRRRLRVNPARPPAPGGYVHAVVPWNRIAKIAPTSSS